jgi:peptidoglycan hydrolase-like protein with peptidoglycan-binding domain
MTRHEFAVLIRNKYPGNFNDVKDETLVNSVLEKYPQYKSLITDSPIVTLTKKEFISQIRKKYPIYNNVSDDDLINAIIEKYPAYKKIISDLTNPVITTPDTIKKSQFIDVDIKTEDVASGAKLVKIGMRGDIVKKIQELLIKHGFTNISKSGTIDGKYGSRTKQAVIDFQRKNEASDDGIVGKETWGKLIQEPTSAKVPVKLDPKTGLPDNSLGLPKFNPDLKRFEKYNISKAQQAADLERLKIQENMKLTDIITGMVQEDSHKKPLNELPGGAMITKAYADKQAADAAAKVVPQQPNSLTDVAKGGYLRFNMKGNVIRDMQVLLNSLNYPEVKIDTNAYFNQQTLDAVIFVQKKLGVKPKNGRYGIFGPITLAAINKAKAGANDKTTVDPKTGLPDNSLGLPKFDTDANKFSKYGVSKAQQAGDLQKLGLQEDLVKKIVSKHLHSKL